jgi:hypothetical protein
LASSACTTVQLPVVTTNKCPLVLNSELSTTDPLVTCPPINLLTPIWLNNGFTPSLAANPILTCTGGNITMNATPSNGSNYIWKENLTSQPYFGNSTTQIINYTSANGIYTSKIDVDITRNQCTQRATQDIKFSRPPTYTSNITHRTCTTTGNNLGAIDIALAPIHSYTYLWSNGATTQDLTNLDPIGASQSYTVTATDNFGCTSSQSYTVNNTSPIEVSIKRKLVNCFTHSSLLYVEYIATASGGQADYNYKWFGLTGNTVLHTGNTYVNVGSYILEVTDANGCSRRFQVDPNIELISATSDNTPGFQTSYSNSILRFANDFTITKPWTLTNCDMVYTTMGQKTTIASPSAQAGMQLINSTIHTCGDFMARGIVMTQAGDYFYPQNSTLEDMYAAIAIEPAIGHTAGNFYLPMSGNTFRNNFIGIRINAPHINLDQTRISALGPFIPEYFSGNRFEGAVTIKPYSAAFYPSSLISTLEKSYNASNWGSYAATVLNHNGSFSFSSIGIGSSPSPNYFKNMANGILTHKGHRIITDCKFENLGIGSIPTPSSFALYGYAIYGTGSASTGDKLTINGYGTWLQDMQNVRHGVYAQDMNLDMNSIIINNLPETAIRIERTSTAAVESKITNNTITAKIPIHITAKANDIIHVKNNFINDDLPSGGSANTSGALLTITGSNVNMANNTLNEIANNNLTVKYSRYGIHINNVNGSSNTNRYFVKNNNLAIFNTTSSFTHAGIYLQTVQNYNAEGNTIYMGYLTSHGVTTTGAISGAFATNSSPIGIRTNTPNNLKLSCNDLYTQAGTYHDGAHTNFELLTNNFVSKEFGAVFQNYTGGSVIRGLSNKFYCSMLAANFINNNSGPPVDISLGGLSFSAWPLGCIAPFPFCTSNPPFAPSFSYYPGTLPSGFTPLTAPAVDDNCKLICNLPKLAGANKKEQALNPSCQLYPNPNRGEFRLAFDEISVEIEYVEVHISELTGRRVYSANQALKNKHVEVQTQLPIGNYIVQIYHPLGLSLTKKLTISEE